MYLTPFFLGAILAVSIPRLGMDPNALGPRFLPRIALACGVSPQILFLGGLPLPSSDHAYQESLDASPIG